MTENPDELKPKDDASNLDQDTELKPLEPVEEEVSDLNDDFEEETFIDFDEEDFDDDFDDDFEDAVEGEYEMEDDEFKENVPEFNADGSVVKPPVDDEPAK